VATGSGSPQTSPVTTTSTGEPYRELIELALSQGRNAMSIWQELVDKYGSPVPTEASNDMARRFTENCKKLDLAIHGDVIVGLPGETRESIRRTIDFAKRLDTETIQVSIAHALPGTELRDYATQNGPINLSMADEAGHQLPNITYPRWPPQNRPVSDGRALFDVLKDLRIAGFHIRRSAAGNWTPSSPSAFRNPWSLATCRTR
jgi:hypothetical protein